jgi:trk system potassium uptake protein TrkA
MRTVVAGAGNIGRHLADDLRRRGHEVTLIDQDPAILDRARQDVSEAVTLLLGDACEPWVLDKADLRSADVVVAATGDDEDNLVIALLSKQEYGVPRVVARVNHPKNEWMFTDQWGVDVPMSPPQVLTALVEEAVTVGDLVRLLKLEGGQVTLVEMTLDPSAPITGRPMYELRLPPDCAVMAILREGHVVIPQPETKLLPGDEVLAITTPENEADLRSALLGPLPGDEPAPGPEV